MFMVQHQQQIKFNIDIFQHQQYIKFNIDVVQHRQQGSTST
jgi:hypothetical protein